MKSAHDFHKKAWTMNRFFTSIVIFCLAGTFSCGPKYEKEIQDGPKNKWITGRIGGAIVEEFIERVWHVGGMPIYPYDQIMSHVCLVEVAPDGNSCKLEVKSFRARTTSSEWVRVGEHTTQFPEFGIGLKVIRVEADQAILGYYNRRDIREDLTRYVVEDDDGQRKVPPEEFHGLP